MTWETVLILYVLLSNAQVKSKSSRLSSNFFSSNSDVISSAMLPLVLLIVPAEHQLIILDCADRRAPVDVYRRRSPVHVVFHDGLWFFCLMRSFQVIYFNWASNEQYHRFLIAIWQITSSKKLQILSDNAIGTSRYLVYSSTLEICMNGYLFKLYCMKNLKKVDLTLNTLFTKVLVHSRKGEQSYIEYQADQTESNSCNLQFLLFSGAFSPSCPVCIPASSTDGADTGCLGFSSRTLAGSLDNTSKARAGQPALKWPCAVWKYRRLSRRVMLSSGSCCSRASVPPWRQ